MSIVSVSSCSDYEINTVRESLKAALQPMGGMVAFIKKGDRVLVKPNLLMKRRPEEATTTHPALVQVLAEEVLAAGGIVTIADSPGGPYTTGMLKGLYDATGMKQVQMDTGVRLNEDVGMLHMQYPQGAVSKVFPVITPLAQVDKVISVAKLKTHMMSYMTGAVKNLFGLIPGTYKAEYHFRMPDKRVFCSMLVDLCEMAKPVLSVVDAVYCMEGDGPSSGQVKFAGYIVAGDNPHATDYICANLIDAQPDNIYTLTNAIERGLFHPDKIKLAGQYRQIKDFKKPGIRGIHFLEGHFLLGLVDRLVTAKPAVDDKKCIGCGECAKVCPPGVILMENRRPKIDYKGCIGCFCCHELCPHKAMDLKGRGLWNFIRKLIS